MEQQNTNTKNTTTAEKLNIFKGNKVWETTLKDLEAWQIARRNLDKWLDEAETGTFGSFFESKTNRTAPFSLQNLAIVCHTSSGYIGDLVRKAKEKGMEKALKEHVAFDEQSCYISLILDTLAPNLAEERAKREAERAAVIGAWNARVMTVISTVESILSTWKDFDIPCDINSVRKMVIKYRDKDNGLNIISTLANGCLNNEDCRTVEHEIGLEPNTLDDYWLTGGDIDNPPESMFENV